MKNEVCHFNNNYLCVNPYIMHFGFNCITEQELDYVLHHLTPLNAPDMFSVLEDKIIIIEHFQFDASRATRKGMKGLCKENELKRRIDNYAAGNESSEWSLEKTDYEISFSDWQNNFENTFNNHYKKINTYINNVTSYLNKPNNNIITGFLIENEFPPIINKNEKFFGELPYYATKQFWDFFFQKEKVGFVIFMGGLYGKRQITYIDHKSMNYIEHIIDITDNRISLSPLNYNEVTMYSSFTLKQKTNISIPIDFK